MTIKQYMKELDKITKLWNQTYGDPKHRAKWLKAIKKLASRLVV